MNYSHSFPNLRFVTSVNNRVSTSKENYNKEDYLLSIALLAHEIANFIGIKADYSTKNNNFERLTVEMAETSHIIGGEVSILRGWNYFQSCIKGFNSLGLMAAQILPLLIKYETNIEEFSSDFEKFISTRKDYKSNLSIHSIAKYKSRLYSHSSNANDKLCVAIWKCFSRRSIICSTSSNMGISLHESLRSFQCKEIIYQSKSYPLLNDDEGKLVIWCPDREADFMNDEKADMLKSLEDEEPKTTILRTYINRQQRDPGALSDALNFGGYFFPTNPQSLEEVQNLLFVGLKELSTKKNLPINTLLKSKNVLLLLDSLGAEIKNETVVVRRPVEGGIGGLMIPYLIMVEEHLRFRNKEYHNISTWNQASIGAALAAAVEADKILRGYSKVSTKNKELLSRLFYNIGNNFRGAKKLCLNSKIHGLFDLANIQSLAQLLGVTVLNHTSGRGTAFVGLGSSSYSNGNLCFDTLNESLKNDLGFKGKETFHPATHTMNFIAQGIIYGEGILLSKRNKKHKQISFKKPEPAGAAALAGFLLLYLDNKFLSIYQIALLLKKIGFDEANFLEFCNFQNTQEGKSSFIQLAFEEGPNMGNFASNLLDLITLPMNELIKSEKEETKISKLNQKKDIKIEFLGLSSKYNNYIYSTGDNTYQPSDLLRNNLLKKSKPILEEINIDKKEKKFFKRIFSFRKK